jgi:hypothetical protein
VQSTTTHTTKPRGKYGIDSTLCSKEMGNENKISLIYRLVRVIFKGKAHDVDLQIKCKGWLPINFASVVVAEKEKG